MASEPVMDTKSPPETVEVSVAERAFVEPTFAQVARHEFGMTARAFFAPIVGTLAVMRALVREVSQEDRDARRREHDAAA